MYYVNPSDVMKKFKDYLEDYGDLISKESAVDELQDALDDAECEWIDAEGE